MLSQASPHTGCRFLDLESSHADYQYLHKILIKKFQILKQYELKLHFD